MSTIAEYLRVLDSLRDQMADNLQKMGVTASQNETLQTLVPKILGIQQGNLEHEYCKVRMLNFPASYGFYTFEETALLAGAVEVTGFYMIRSAEILLSANSGLTRLLVTAPNWEITRSDTEIRLKLDAVGKTKGQFTDLLDLIKLQISGTDPLVITVTMAVVGDETGDVIGAAGSAQLRWQNGSWGAFEAHNYTWDAIEKAAYTWDDLERIGKP